MPIAGLLLAYTSVSHNVLQIIDVLITRRCLSRANMRSECERFAVDASVPLAAVCHAPVRAILDMNIDDVDADGQLPRRIDSANQSRCAVPHSICD